MLTEGQGFCLRFHSIHNNVISINLIVIDTIGLVNRANIAVRLIRGQSFITQKNIVMFFFSVSK